MSSSSSPLRIWVCLSSGCSRPSWCGCSGPPSPAAVSITRVTGWHCHSQRRASTSALAVILSFPQASWWTRNSTFNKYVRSTTGLKSCSCTFRLHGCTLSSISLPTLLGSLGVARCLRSLFRLPGILGCRLSLPRGMRLLFCFSNLITKPAFPRFRPSVFKFRCSCSR